MRSLCPFTKSMCDEKACALWLKDLERCSFKEIALQMHGLRREFECLNANIDLLPHRLKKKK